MMHFCKNNSGGFTLVEVVLAATVTAVGLVGYAASLISTHDLRKATSQTIRAMNVARYAIEEIEAIDDVDYIVNNLNGYSFAIASLDGPKMTESYSDGTYPEHFTSYTLPQVPGQETTGGTTSSVYDPVMHEEHSYMPLALEPAHDSTRGFGTVTVDATDPDLLQVEVMVQFRSARGNRKLIFRSHMVRPVDPATFSFE